MDEGDIGRRREAIMEGEILPKVTRARKRNEGEMKAIAPRMLREKDTAAAI